MMTEKKQDRVCDIDSPAPPSLTLELQADVVCPVKCPHCSHRAAYRGDENSVFLDLTTSLSLIRQAAEMGVAACIAYPRQGDVSLERDRYVQLFSSAKSLGMQTKTTSACVNPDGLVPLIPYLDQLTVSIDGFEKTSFSRFRPAWLLKNISQFLTYLAQNRPQRFRLAVNVVVTKSFIKDGIGSFVEKIVSQGMFDKLNFIEILPGADDSYWGERLGRAELEQLIALKKRFKSEIKITIPTWEAGEYDLPSCPLGRDFLVIGPEGNVAACVLLLHGGLYTTNIFQEDSLASTWEKIRVFAFKEAREPLFSARSSFPLRSDLRECRKCRLFETHRCFGGCIARARLFGHPFEINRQCQGPLN